MYVIANLNHPRSLSINLDRPWRIQMHMLPYMHPLATKPRYILSDEDLCPYTSCKTSCLRPIFLLAPFRMDTFINQERHTVEGLEIPP